MFCNLFGFWLYSIVLILFTFKNIIIITMLRMLCQFGSDDLLALFIIGLKACNESLP